MRTTQGAAIQLAKTKRALKDVQEQCVKLQEKIAWLERTEEEVGISPNNVYRREAMEHLTRARDAEKVIDDVETILLQPTTFAPWKIERATQIISTYKKGRQPAP